MPRASVLRGLRLDSQFDAEPEPNCNPRVEQVSPWWKVTEVYPDGDSRYQGEYRWNARHGVGVEWLPDGARYSGRWVEGKFSGPANCYVYPDGDLVLKGHWVDGVMVEARLGGNRRDGIRCPQIYRYDPSTATRISSDPMVEDPYQAVSVRVGLSSIYGAGDGLFAVRGAPPGRVICYFTGLRISVAEANSRSWCVDRATIPALMFVCAVRNPGRARCHECHQ